MAKRKVVGRAVRAGKVAAQISEPKPQPPVKGTDPDDRTAYEARQLRNPNAKGEHYDRMRRMIKDYRTRQTQGRAAPQWRKWSEFDVTMHNGEVVRCLYVPSPTDPADAECPQGSAHAQFYGPLTPTGYRSWFFQDEPDEFRYGPLERHMTFVANRVLDETLGILRTIARTRGPSKAERQAAVVMAAVAEEYADPEAEARALGII